MTTTRFTHLDVHTGKESPTLSVNLDNVPSSDPLSFADGFSRGYRGDTMGEVKPEDEVAKEYIAGYQWGVKVRSGKKKMPSWAKVEKT